MAVDYFLKLDGIPGESTDAKHKDEIDVLAFSWGVSHPKASGPGGGGAGKAVFEDLLVVAHTSKASPKLWLACASGQHIKEATITVRKAGSDKGQEDYLVLTMTDVLVSSFQASGSSGSDRPTESVSMAFAKVEFTYKPQKETGGTSGDIRVGWDLKKNAKI